MVKSGNSNYQSAILRRAEPSVTVELETAVEGHGYVCDWIGGATYLRRGAVRLVEPEIWPVRSLVVAGKSDQDRLDLDRGRLPAKLVAFYAAWKPGRYVCPVVERLTKRLAKLE